MDYAKFAFPKVRTKADGAVIIYRNDREKCTSSTAGRAEYQRRRELAWKLYDGACVLCGLAVFVRETTVDHVKGRGSGGSKRDDRMIYIWPAHLFCNNARGSKKVTAENLETAIHFLKISIERPDYLSAEESALATEILALREKELHEFTAAAQP